MLKITQYAKSWGKYGPQCDKTCLRDSDKARLKAVSSATSMKSEILPEASHDMILSNKQITKVLTRLRGCPGWSGLCCSQTPKNRFSRVRPK